jgi:hypothetical protein
MGFKRRNYCILCIFAAVVGSIDVRQAVDA